MQLCSEGKPIGRKVALNGDDPARIAARLTRDVWAKTKQRNFNRPLVYAPPGIAWRSQMTGPESPGVRPKRPVAVGFYLIVKVGHPANGFRLSRKDGGSAF